MKHTTLDPVFAAALRRELVALPTATPRRVRRRLGVIATGVIGAVTLGGVTAVASLMPAGEVASPPLAPPVILNGVGPAKVILPAAPKDAVYLRVELTCYDGTHCWTPGGGVGMRQGGVEANAPMVQRDALPLSAEPDPHNAQSLAPLEPASGLPIDVDPGTHWRLYAVYTDGLNVEAAPVGNGQTLGIPSNDVVPDLVPAVATNGKAGWVNYHQLTDQAHPELTQAGTGQAPIPVYADDGTTIIGKANVSQPYR
jgi:hypothetical protein